MDRLPCYPRSFAPTVPAANSHARQATPWLPAAQRPSNHVDAGIAKAYAFEGLFFYGSSISFSEDLFFQKWKYMLTKETP